MRILIYIGLLSVALGSCTQRSICPAYQSAFIHDKEELRKKFSYFDDDAVPRGGKANKNKYLIAEPVTYRKKVESLNTVPMKAVATNVPDSLKHASQRDVAADLDKAARSVIDSTYIEDVGATAEASAKSGEGVYMISVDREHHVLKYDPIKRQYWVDSLKYNVDQDNYMWYLRKQLVLPDARLAQEEAAETEKTERKAEKKGLFSFLKREKSGEEKPKRQKKEKKAKVEPEKVAPVIEEKDEEEEEDDGF